MTATKDPVAIKKNLDQEPHLADLSRDIQDGNPVVSAEGKYESPEESEFIPDDRTGAPLPVNGGKGESSLSMH